MQYIEHWTGDTLRIISKKLKFYLYTFLFNDSTSKELFTWLIIDTLCRYYIIYLDLKVVFICKVAAQTGHRVTLVDLDQNILDQSTARINKSLQRVAKKKFPEDVEGAKSFMESTMGAISTATSAGLVTYI